MNYCHNDISENEVNENLNPEVTLQDDKDRNFDDILINLVKSYPHLYDSSCKDYRDVIKKENSWVEISKILDTSRKFHFLCLTMLTISYSIH
ncbi:hypothetical protein ALC60_02597 [Trachymyrmex zeteki]|uniref:MADF domain-containing protein n=1 Tax=Mycetomoellerius zeteki TaxID=64791 RepID=A0A151XDM6_9HYME|nr:hypothetical protein ALC60_02597 [Trachymyrmex zeteki]